MRKVKYFFAFLGLIPLNAVASEKPQMIIFNKSQAAPKLYITDPENNQACTVIPSSHKAEVLDTKDKTPIILSTQGINKGYQLTTQHRLIVIRNVYSAVAVFEVKPDGSERFLAYLSDTKN